MELKLNYKGKDYNKIKELVIKAYNDISLRFGDKLENMVVCVHKNRKEFDKKLNRKTKILVIPPGKTSEHFLIAFVTVPIIFTSSKVKIY